MFSSPRWQLAGVLVRRDARWLRTHLQRGIALSILWFLVWQFSGQSWRQAAGRDLLSTLTMASGIVLIIAALDAFSSVFTDEWTGPNLDLLRISGLSPFDLLLARSLPQGLTAITLIVLQLPFALVAVTLGGVTLTQIAALAVQLAVLYAVVSGCAVIWGVVTATQRLKLQTARMLTLVTLGMYLGLTTVVDGLLQELRIPQGSGPRPAVRGILLSESGWINPLSEFRRILDSGFRGPVVSWPVLFHAGLVLAMFGVSGHVLRSRWQSVSEDAATETTPENLEAHPLWRPVNPPPRCTANAIEWKEYYFTLSGPELIAGKGVACCFILVFLVPATFSIDRSDLGILVMLDGGVLFLTVACLAYTANRLWKTEFQERTLWGLALLPMTPQEVILAKLKALARVLVPEMIVLAVAMLLPLRFGNTIGTAIIGSVFASLPLVICTDTAWRFIDPSWEGLTGRAKLFGMVLAIWSLAGMIGYFVHPLAGLFVLLFVLPFGGWLAIDEAAKWFAWRAGEMSEK